MKLTWTISVGTEQIILTNKGGQSWSWSLPGGPTEPKTKEDPLPRSIQNLLSQDLETEELRVEAIRNKVDRTKSD